ncbi:CGNR zinc finger domain-containing protein [Amycolatopsis pretoriensis]|uniref:CGNR zinc finger domain-containing protein n=1 Tax=Amycolatopsis pretoriensis TaxID=218821 RepID=A0A1H5Q7X3_9PSEU|nr:CGNR zinc finger domain-containing protein [Amycolatopsis pretoriensis]SEF22213.1 CGNR zinc finger domain-containing protein [Amycolatopsis pretoriensis]
MSEDFRLDMGAPWLNLLATRGRHFGTQPIERLPSADRLREWLALSELTPLAPVTDADLDRARELREALRPLALGAVDDLAPSAEQVRALAEVLAPEPVHLAALDRLHRSAPPTAAAAFARLAHQAADWLTGPLRHDLRACPEQDCRGVFADPGGRRRWCPSPACASRGRVRALRERRRGES